MSMFDRTSSLLFATFCTAICLSAQTTGLITGTVTDPTGSNVPNAQVVIRNAGTGEIRAVETNSSGTYGAYALAVGQYDINVTAPGFKKTAKTGIQVNVADKLAINFALEVGNVSETVEVTGATPTVDTQTADVGYTVSTRQVTDLAVNGREFTSL